MPMIFPLSLNDIDINNNAVQISFDFSVYVRSHFDACRHLESLEYVRNLVPAISMPDREHQRLKLAFEFSNFADGVSPVEQIQTQILEAFNHVSADKAYWA
jgi:hypothetical protein